MSKYDNMIGSFGLDDVQEISEDVMEAWDAFLYTFITCIIVTILYALIIYGATALIVWVSIIATGVGILALAVFVRSYHGSHYAGDDVAIEKKESSYASIVKWTEYALWALAVIYLCCVCCMYKNIAISIGILKTASMVIIRNIRMLFVPFASQIFLFCWCILWLYDFGWLISSGKITQPKAGS